MNDEIYLREKNMTYKIKKTCTHVRTLRELERVYLLQV